MKDATAFSPGHITGFFQICDQLADPLLKGSLGAGVSITKGVMTRVSFKKAAKTSFDIKINNQAVRSANVSRRVIEAFLPHISESYRFLVDHEVEIPIGAGFGSSGAGALSLALALNEALGCNLSYTEAAQVAHVAEVECKTGLGTVIAEACGGLEIRVKPGGPGVGEVIQMADGGDYAVAYLCFAPISTEEILTDGRFQKKMSILGGKLVNELVKNPKPESFMMLSRRFAESTGLISNRVRKILNEADKNGFTCSMAMFGESVFTVAERDSLDRLLKIFHEHASSSCSIMVAEIDFKGARLL